MKFLEEIAEYVLKHHAGATDKVTLVFPNRRAGLFFQKYLSARVAQPIWSPKIVSIEDFIKSFSPFKTADKLDLIFELYKVFTQLNKSGEEFDSFFYWGDVLLQDFDELDKFMTDAELLFKNLAYVKELENNLDYLEESQKQLILDFWKSFGDKLSTHKKGFLTIWNNLFQVYTQFKKRLTEKGIAYNGMIYHQVAAKLDEGLDFPKDEKVIFAGFNALSKSEEQIITWFVEEGLGTVFWDADDHYLKDNRQEAGRFLREMKFGNAILRKTFRDTYGNAFAEQKNIQVVSVASDVGQAQQAAEVLRSISGKLDEHTAVVLPNNALLFPLLHAMPPGVEKLNITMGYPLASSTVYGFLDALIEMQVRAENKGAYHFRSVLTILQHPLLTHYHNKNLLQIVREIMQKNILWVPKKMLEGSNLLQLVFTEVTDMSDYLKAITLELASKSEDEVEQEFFYHFFTLLNQMYGFTQQHQLQLPKAAYQKIFRQLVRSERLPFEGEPLLGLQVMGILETRNLDFENVIVLSMNESLLPPAAKNASFIPYSIRKVFELPVVDQQDSMYAYIFYRLVQRATNVTFIYNSTEGTGKNSEISRFVHQLEYETKWNISHSTATSEVTIEDPNEISITKNEGILERLRSFTSKKNFEKRFTPTALNTYLDCRLRFYFKYVLELYEPEEVAEEVDPMVFGNILHRIMEKLYLPYDRDGHRTIEEENIISIEKRIDVETGKAFAQQFGAEEDEYKFEGQNILAKEIIRKMILKVLEYDKQQTPFELLGVEADEKKGFVLNTDLQISDEKLQVGMKGIIDRIEQKDGIVRIVDYKTGQDAKHFTDIHSLFDRELKSRNKAVFQTFFYGLLYLESPIGNDNAPIQASLFNIRELFKSNFTPLIQNKINRSMVDVMDIRPFLSEFKSELNSMLKEMFDEEVPFSQTTDTDKCKYCPYAGICNRRP